MTLVVREADAAECRAAGFEPEEALRLSILHSNVIRWEYAPRDATFFDDVDEMCVWGWRVSGFLTLRADVWLLTSDHVTKHPIYFAKRSRKYVEELLKTFRELRCEVHVAYTDSVKWLLWLGFRRIGERVIGSETFLIMQKDRG